MAEEEEQVNAKRLKLDKDSGSDVDALLHIGEDKSSPDIKLVHAISQKLFFDDKTADICFLFETSNDDAIERIPAHKVILSTGSKVFEKMFFGSIPEGNEVKISNANSTAFKEFLQFFYLDQITLTLDNIADVMNLVRQYQIERCMVKIVDFLKDTMTNNNVCSIYELALTFELQDLQHFCDRKISANADDVLKTDGFLNCSWNLLKCIVGLDSLMCDEKNVFDACVAWAKKSCEDQGLDHRDSKNLRERLGEEVLHLIHFNRMTIEEFAQRNAEHFGIYTASELTEILLLVAFKNFKSIVFKTKPLFYGVFTWDEQRMLNFSLIERFRYGKNIKTNRKTESAILTFNKPVLLDKIKFSKVYAASANFFKGSDDSIVRFELLEKINLNASEKLLFGKNFYVSYENDVIVKFTKPIFIHPKRTYKVLLKYNKGGQFKSAPVQCGKAAFDDLELNLMCESKDDYRFELLNTIFFNRL